MGGAQMRVGWPSWSLEPQPAWDVSDDDECLTLTSEDGGGAFQLSSARKAHGTVTSSELEWGAKHLKGLWTSPEHVTYGPFSGVWVSSVQEGAYWRWWFLAAGPVLLRATYNAPPAFKALELPQVEQMLRTLRVEEQRA